MTTAIYLRSALFSSALLMTCSHGFAQSELSTPKEPSSEKIVIIDNHAYSPDYHPYKNYSYSYPGHSNYVYNKPTYARLGIYMKTSEAGVLLRSVSNGSAAAEAGLRADDRIIAFAGIKIKSINQFIALIQHHKGGEEVRVDYQRNGQVTNTTVTLETRTNPHTVSKETVPCDEITAITGRPFLGIYMTNSHAQQEQTVRITSIISNTGADRSGLHSNDRIIGIDGQRMNNVKEVRNFIHSHQPGDHVQLAVLRDRQHLIIPATIGHYGESPTARQHLAVLEILCEQYNHPKQSCQLLSSMTGAPYLGIYMSRDLADEGEGTLVTSVVSGTSAERAQLMGGDRILRMNGQAVNGYEATADFIESKQPGDAVTIEVLRGDQLMTTQATIGSLADKEIYSAQIAYLEQMCEEAANRPDEEENSGKQRSSEKALPQSTTAHLQLFPNPSNTYVMALFESDATPLTIIMTNLEGQSLYNEFIPQFQGIYNKQIDVSNFPAGVYVISFIQDDNVTTKQVIVE